MKETIESHYTAGNPLQGDQPNPMFAPESYSSKNSLTAILSQKCSEKDSTWWDMNISRRTSPLKLSQPYVTYPECHRIEADLSPPNTILALPLFKPHITTQVPPPSPTSPPLLMRTGKRQNKAKLAERIKNPPIMIHTGLLCEVIARASHPILPRKRL